MAISGTNDLIASMQLDPSPQQATNLKSRSAPSTSARPCRTMGWRSAITTRIQCIHQLQTNASRTSSNYHKISPVVLALFEGKDVAPDPKTNVRPFTYGNPRACCGLRHPVPKTHARRNDYSIRYMVISG